MLEFFSPVADATLGHLQSKAIVQRSGIHLQEHQPEINDGSILFATIVDEKYPTSYPGNALSAQETRRKLYELSAFDRHTNIVDLGNLITGRTSADTLASLGIVIEEAYRAGCILILVGGSRELWRSAYNSLGPIRKNLEVSAIDKSLDLNPESVFQEMILSEPNYLFNLSVLGVQSHHVWIESREVFQKLGFDLLTLGAMRNDIFNAEALLRNTDVLLTDMSAIANAYAPGTRNPGPNGLSGEDLCRLTRFAGAGNNCRLLWLSEIDLSSDSSKITAQLGAQAIWYFAEGISNRRFELPAGNRNAFTRFIVPLLEGGHELIFYKSNDTGRWWVEVPHPRAGIENRHPLLFPCTYNDYQSAMRNEVPDRWWRNAQKYA